MKETTYEIDGVIYESVVTQSNTCRILANGGRGAMAMYGEIAKLRDGWIEQVESSMPTGLCRQSWLSRFPDEVKADAGAMMNFIYDKYPKQAKRLFCGTDEFTDFATSFNSVVFPAFGGETIIPRCPFPIGETRSTIRIASPLRFVSRRRRSLGKIGVRSSKFLRFAATEGG